MAEEYIRDYCGPLQKSCDSTSLRDQSRQDNPLETAFRLLDRDIQLHNRQDAQDQWRNLLKSSDSSTNPQRNWFLMSKLSGSRLSPLPLPPS